MTDLPSQGEYYVRPDLQVSVTEDGWSILSQMILLGSLHRFGYGNWGNIKIYLDCYGYNYTENQIENHYNQFYLTQNLEPICFDIPTIIQKKNEFTPCVINSDSFTSVEQQNRLHCTFQPYNAKRQEHLYDYDSEAEQLVANLQFLENDSPQEQELKYQQLEQYNRRVKQRTKREKFVIQHKLLSEEYNRKLLSQGRVKADIRRSMSCFGRFMSYQQSQNIVSYLTLQTTLKATVRELVRQRRKLKEPLFEHAFSLMEQIKNKRSQQHYRNVAQLKIQNFGIVQRKRGCPIDLNVDQMTKKLKQVGVWEDNMKVTTLLNQ